jgi:hypothetical protein
VSTPAPKNPTAAPSKRFDTGVFLGVIALPIAVLVYVLQANGVVEIVWWVSALIYLAAVAAMVWAFYRWNVPAAWSPVRRTLACLVGCIVLVGLSGVGIRTEYAREHPKPQSVRSTVVGAPPASPVATPDVHHFVSQGPPPAQPRSSRRVVLIFKDSPLLTAQRREIIQTRIDNFNAYLTDVGFSLPKDFPPIGVSSRNNFAGGGIYPGTIYEQSFYLPKNKITDGNEIRWIYAYGNFGDLFPVDAGHEEFHEQATTLFSDYYAGSYADHRWGDSAWDRRLWELRKEKGKQFTDKSLFFAYEQWRSPGPSEPDFDSFFRSLLLAGVWVESNNRGADMTEVNKILASVN